MGYKKKANTKIAANMYADKQGMVHEKITLLTTKTQYIERQFLKVINAMGKI